MNSALLLPLIVTAVYFPARRAQPDRTDATPAAEGRAAEPALAATNRRLLGELDKEIEAAKSARDNALREIAEFRATEEIFAEPGSIENGKVATLRALVTELEVDSLGKKAQWEALEKPKPEELPITADLQNLLNNDPDIHHIEERLRMAEEDFVAVRSRNNGDENQPDVKAANAVREFLAQEAESERAKKVLRFAMEQKEQARRNFLEATEQLVRLRERLFQAEQELRDREQKRWRHDHMVGECDRLQRRYERLLDERHLLTRMPRLVEMLGALKLSAAAANADVDTAVTLDLSNPAGGPRVMFKVSRSAESTVSRR